MRSLVFAVSIAAAMPQLATTAAYAQNPNSGAPSALNSTRATDVSLETPTGTIFGTLLLPPGNPPFPVALLIAGSGMTDRDGNSAGIGKSDCLKLLAEEFARAGIATLRYDKRGVGASVSARAKTNTFDIQAEDAAGWIHWLGQSPRFRSVAIVGHSEGSLVGTVAAAGGGVRALVSLAGPADRFDQVLIGQMERAAQSGQFPPAALPALRSALAELRQGRTVDTRPSEIPRALWTALFQPRAQEYLISIFRFDPSAEIAKLPPKGIRVMVVQGTTDLQKAGVDEAERLAAAVGAKPVLIEGMNHELRAAPLDRAANDRASENPSLPLAPALLDQLIRFLTDALK